MADEEKEDQYKRISISLKKREAESREAIEVMNQLIAVVEREVPAGWELEELTVSRW